MGEVGGFGRGQTLGAAPVFHNVLSYKIVGQQFSQWARVKAAYPAGNQKTNSLPPAGLS